MLLVAWVVQVQMAQLVLRVLEETLVLRGIQGKWVILVFRVQLEKKVCKVSRGAQVQRVNKDQPDPLEFKVIRVYKE